MISALLFLALAADYPEATISNGSVTAKLMLPDPEKGSYRGTRFDWSGIIASLTYSNHEYFGQWFPKDDPKIHDSITGPVEEFLSNDAGLGYADTKVGDTFIRIGVGAVRKPDEKAYRRFATYDIVDPGKRTLRRGKNWIEFGHQVSAGGYAYDYRKTIRLYRTGFTIVHDLKNTGAKTIDTQVYNHDFFVIDHEVVGPDVVVKFSWSPKPDKPFENGGEISGDEIHYFRIENKKTLAGVRITGDQPLTKLYFWSIRTVACPEPYIHISVAPKSSYKWSSRYDLYTFLTN
jgi:hypothetical protein